MAPEDVADNILIAFKNAIRQAGSLKEDEYQRLYRKAEDQLRHYLSHLLTLINSKV
jgi:hypothetical protein